MTATIKDFKAGAKLVTTEGFVFVLADNTGDGVWIARGDRGMKCIFESDANSYSVLNT